MNTTIIRDEIGKQESIAELEAYFERHSNDIYKPWKNYFHTLLADSGLTISEIADGLEVSVSTAKRMKKAVPFKRDHVIMIAAMLGMTPDETDLLLTRYCKMPALYAKNIDDFIWLSLLNNGASMTPAADFRRYKTIAENELAAHRGEANGKASPDTSIVKGYSRTEEFITAIRLAIPGFSSSLDKFKAYLNDYIGGDLFNLTYSEKGASFLKLHYDTQAKLKKGKIPSRLYLLCLSFYLTKTSDELNELLEMAGYGPLCVTDKLEALLFFSLEKNSLLLPGFFNLEGRDDSEYFASLEKKSKDVIVTFADIAKLTLAESNLENSIEKKRLLNYLTFISG